jgi:hypothetical protein
LTNLANIGAKQFIARGTKMDIVWLYIGFLGSWWWLAIAGFTFVSVIAFVLQGDDYTLTYREALKLALVGLGSLIPLLSATIPAVLRLDFRARWILISLGENLPPFNRFAVTMVCFCFFFAPVAFVLFFGALLLDKIEEATRS